MGGQRSARWKRAARVAARQHGVVTRAQLLGLGITTREIERRLEDGRLVAIHRGVYLLGPNPGPLTYEMAAVLACGRPAALSHRSAGHVWELLPYLPKRRLQHVTVTSGNPRSRTGIRVHRAPLTPGEHSINQHIPITTPARTVFDLAAELADDDLEQAIAEAFARYRVTKVKLLRIMDIHPGHRGARRLRKHLGRPAARTRSRTDRRLLTLIRVAARLRARLPQERRARGGGPARAAGEHRPGAQPCRGDAKSHQRSVSALGTSARRPCLARPCSGPGPGPRGSCLGRGRP
jgi:hypothetical protein